jgi:hypothetical protein
MTDIGRALVVARARQVHVVIGEEGAGRLIGQGPAPAERAGDVHRAQQGSRPSLRLTEGLSAYLSVVAAWV